MSVGTRTVSPMKPSAVEQMETLGRHFDTIRETQADAARVAARLAEQVDEARRYAEAAGRDAARNGSRPPCPGPRGPARVAEAA